MASTSVSRHNHLLSGLLPARPKPTSGPTRVRMPLRDDGPAIAVVVGQEFLSDHDFPYRSIKMLALQCSAGGRIVFEDRDYVLEELTADSLDGVDIALFSAGGSISKKFGPAAVDRGTVVVDNSSVFGMDENLALVIPEVNPEAMQHIKAGTGKGALIANPNYSTITNRSQIY